MHYNTKANDNFMGQACNPSIWDSNALQDQLVLHTEFQVSLCYKANIMSPTSNIHQVKLSTMYIPFAHKE